MKIAIITPFQISLRRGIEGVNWNVAVNLVQDENTYVDLLTWQSPNPINWGKEPSRLKVRVVPYTRYFAKWLAVPFYLYWILRNHYDWVLITFAGYGELESLSLLRLIRCQNYGIVFHFPYEQVPHRYAEFRRYGLVDNAKFVSAVSKYVSEGVEYQFNRSCRVVGNGVDIDRYKPSVELRLATRQQRQIPSERPVIITLAALEERKGIQWVIRSLPYLIEDYPDLEYWILGEGKFRIQIEAEIQNLGLQEHVYLLGQVDDIVPLLAVADVACLLSTGEAFPLALIECMAMELPVIVSNAPPFPDLINPLWGITVDQQQSQTVAGAIRQLLSDDAQRYDMGLAGRAEVLKHYTWANIAEKYLTLLNGPTS